MQQNHIWREEQLIKHGQSWTGLHRVQTCIYREINKRQPKSKEELWEVLKEAWYNIPEDYFRKLQDSLP